MPNTDAAGWMANGSCRGHDHPEWWFPSPTPDHGTSGHLDAIAPQAKTICAGCPVRAQCLDWALVRRERNGVWGGTTPGERDSILRRIGRERRKLRARAPGEDPPPGAARCGTRAGYRRHLRGGEIPCTPCRDAHNTYKRDARAAARQTKGEAS